MQDEERAPYDPMPHGPPEVGVGPWVGPLPEDEKYDAQLLAEGDRRNVVGYEIGRKIGQPLYERDGRIIKRKYFDQTTAFFDKHGNKALVIGRFVPFVRTYITVVAGVTRMERHRFFLWSLVGAVMWVTSICLLGFFLGDAFPTLGESIDKLIIVILAFSVIPILIEWWRHKRTHAAGAEIGPQDGGPDRDILGRDVD
jgi:membrane-associated protein